MENNWIENIHVSEQNKRSFDMEFNGVRDNMSMVSENFNIHKGTLLGGCYKVEDFLGEGHFGLVLKCRNIQTNGMEAIKLNRSEDNVVVEQVREEISILERLRRLKPDTCNIVSFNDYFFHKDNICIAFELLDQNVWQYMMDRYPNGLPMQELRPVIHQLATALFHLKSLGIVHADLKPENIMIEDRNQKPLKVKLIDFGLAFKDKPGEIVQTSWYRAPEVIIDAPFDEAIDMWSLGVTVAELATGLFLYPGNDEADVFKFIIETQGLPPDHVIDQGNRSPFIFSNQTNGLSRWRFKTEKEFAEERGLTFEDTRTMVLRSLDDLQMFMLPDQEHTVDQLQLVDLIKNMMHLDPDKRIKPQMVLQHEFFANYLTHNCDVNPHVKVDVEQQEQRPDRFPEKPNIDKGTLLGGCYKVEDILGEGGFGLVLKCRNIETNGIKAIKLNRSEDSVVVQQARHEISILERLRCLNPDTCNIIHYNDYFFQKDNICIDFELLDQNLWQYMRDRYPNGLPMQELRPVIHQLATALFHLKSLGIVHADLKPENIMIEDRHQKPLKVKLIDFGLAFTDKPDWIVQTTWYRAPEVIIAAPFNEAIDMWSLGVTVAELATGLFLYPGNDEADVFKFIMETQGLPPDHVIDQGNRSPFIFSNQTNGLSRWRFKTEKEFAEERGLTFEDTRTMVLRSLDDLQMFMLPDQEHTVDQLQLVDLIKNMMHLDPDKRIKPQMVLQHEFFANNLTHNCDVNPHVKVDVEQQEQRPDIVPEKPNIDKGTLLGGCYKVEDFLGEGGFGLVLKCRNIETNGIKAIKLNRSEDSAVVQQARHEISILERLRCLNPDTCNIIHYNDYFLHQDNICIAFELLDQDLWEYMRDRYPNGLPMQELRPVIHQLATALFHLKSLGIVHADLKPENIMIEDRHQKPLKVKLIDFGLAFTDKPDWIVQTTWYRAPEVIIAAPFDEAIDMWSLGVTVAELATGLFLYPGNDEEDVFKFIMETQGLPPDHVIDQGNRSPFIFSNQTNGLSRWRFKTEKEFAEEIGLTFEDTRTMVLRSLDDLQKFMLPDQEHTVDQLQLVDLIKNMMHLDPDKRIKPQMVLQHEFFANYLTHNCDVNPHVKVDVEQQEQRPDGFPEKPNIDKGTLLGGCYKVEDFLGEGGFGLVLKCRNIETNGIKAIKLNRSEDSAVVQQARHEISILERLRCLNPDTCYIIHYNNYFLHQDNICIAFELLDQDLWQYMRDRYPNGLPMQELRPVIHQLATALFHLKSLGIVHADLKPENIMIEDRHQKPLKVKLIDFGLAFTDKPDWIVQTTWYRAPEVIIAAPFDEAIDMWSLGVTVAELATGLFLYPGNDEEDVFKFIMETQGLPPDHVIDQGNRSPFIFSNQTNGLSRWRFKTEKEFAAERGLTFEDTRTMVLRSLDDLQMFMLPDQEHTVDQLQLVDLIKNMMHLDPDKRIKPQMVLQHEFFANYLTHNCDGNPHVPIV